MSNNINQCILKLKFDRPLSWNVKAKDLRGAIANRNRDKSLFHQHTTNGKAIFKYPLIQYKIVKGEGILVGLNEGAKAVVNLEILKEKFELCGEKYTLLQNELRLHLNSIGINEEFLPYCFLTPWLALNEKNYEKYQGLRIRGKKKELLEKIVVGNIISMSKGLGYTVPAPIKANIVKFKEVPTSLKGNPMLGFLGSFKVNFEIPDYLGLGKSVSRGFGTIVRQNE